MTTHRQRLETCLSNNKPDKVPVALWRHFPVDDQHPESLARATLAFQEEFDFDLVKVSPASSFCIKDWGAKDTWNGASEGTRDYIGRVIQAPEDWERLDTLNPKNGYLGAQLECLRILVNELGTDTPIIQTIFSPLSQAKNLVGKDHLLTHLRLYPEAVHTGLKTITETTQQYIAAVKECGVSGIFFAVQHAQYGLLNEIEFEAFGKNYDLQTLEPAAEMWLNMVHLHGTNVMFDQIAEYPVQIINWHDQETFPSLKEGKERFGGIVCGGLQRQETIVLGTPEDVKKEALNAIQSIGGQRFILGTGCVVPTVAPYGNILAARQIVER
jgi:uroporphyrinogen decarboxylase